MNPADQPHVPAAPAPPSAAFSVEDVLFTLFRHKRIIAFFACVGIVAAAAVFRLTPVKYSSKAKLVVRYIVEDTSLPQYGQQNVRVHEVGDSTLNTEVELLTSMDVAKEVATNIGPANILAVKGGGDDPLVAAGLIRSGVNVVAARRSEVLTVFFEYPDKSVVLPVLNNLIETYLNYHYKLHQPDYAMDAGEEAQLRDQLLEAERQLDARMRELRVVDIEAMKKVYNLQLEKLNTDLLTAETELAERESVIEQMAPGVLDASKTNKPAPTDAPVPPDKMDDYSLTLGRLSDLNKKEREFRMQGFKDEHPAIVSLRNQREELLSNKMMLETNYPSLATSTTSIVGTSGAGGLDVQAEVAKMLVLKARVKTLSEAITNITTSAFRLSDAEPKIAQLRRERDEAQKKLDFISARRDTVRSGALQVDKQASIKVAESPTPPIRDNKRRLKMTGAVFVGIFGVGLIISFLNDFIFDRTIRRGADVKRLLKLPVLLSIEDTCQGRRPARQNGGSQPNGAVGHLIAPWEDGHHLRQINEGLRERLVTYFQIHDITHKPKLVALTSCHEGSGVTTLAGGLAAALSRTGEGSVLLVDMQNGQGIVKPFYKGKPGGTEPVDFDPQEHFAQESKSLVVTPKGKAGNAAGENDLHNSLADLVPNAATKNYDFIVFDMPTVTPTSVTPRLASHMDVVLLVLEAEKTGQQAASQVSSLLAEARVNTVAVLNKCRRYVPERFSQEL